MKKILLTALTLFCIVWWTMPTNTKADVSTVQVGEVDKALTEISPYVSIDESSIISINEKDALDDNISQESINVSKRFFYEQNRLIKSLQRGENLEDIKIDEMMLKEFEAYFINIAEGPKKVQTTSKMMRGIGGCDGTKDTPHPCPPREVKLEGVSLEMAQQWLIDTGFHRTSPYAGGGKDSETALDFTKCVSANSCVKCAFRDQAVISATDDGKYKVTIQASEPNPEILEYVWPSLTWGFYVKWWHDHYC